MRNPVSHHCFWIADKKEVFVPQIGQFYPYHTRCSNFMEHFAYRKYLGIPVNVLCYIFVPLVCLWHPAMQR